MIVSHDNYPRLFRAFRMIECDGGAHLIGTVYPGEPINLDRFNVPEAWQHLVAGAEAALTHLISGSETLFETFVIGDQDEAEKLVASWCNLTEAHILLNDFFEDWPTENAPFKNTARPSPAVAVNDGTSS
jgi:hypothetical protein